MATRFWVGGSGNWDGTNTTNWAATTGGATGASVPTSADSVTFDSNSGTAATVTVATTGANCSTMNINKSDLTLLQNQSITAASTTTLTNGTWNSNGQAVSSTSLIFAAGTKTLTPSASVFTLTGTNPLQGVSLTGLTMTANTATFTTTNASQTITMNSPSFDFNGATLNPAPSAAGTVLLTSNDLTRTYTFANITYTGPAAKTPVLNFAVNYTATSTITINGNSTTNRVLVGTGTLGTTKTVTAATVVVTNADFQDITGAGAGSWNLSAITGGSGDCLGNTNLTLTTPATQYYRPGGVNTLWSNVGNWANASGGTAGTGRVPLPQDTARFDGSSGVTSAQVQWDMPRLCTDIDCTSATFTTGTFQNTLAASTLYGSLTLKSGMGTLTGGASNLILSGRGSHTITSAGVTLGNSTGWNVTLTTPTGTYTIQDATTIAGPVTINTAGGTLAANNVDVTCFNFLMSANGTLNQGTGNWKLTATTAINIWSVTAGTVNPSTSTITIVNISTNNRTFAGGGKTYGTLTYTVANSAGTLVITGANSFTNINVNPGRALTMPSSTINTISNGANWNVNGVNNGYVYLPGSGYASTPSAAPLNITGDIDLRLQLALDSWTPATDHSVLAKWGAAAADQSYIFRVGPTGALILSLGNGTTNNSSTSSAITGFTAGTLNWIRVTWRASDGRVQFFTSSDGSVWTQLGTNLTNTTGIVSGAAIQSIGIRGDAATGPSTGKFYRAQIRNNILDDGTGIVFDANFTTKAFGADTFTESSSNAATVTLNGLAIVGDGRMQLTSSVSSTAATISATTGVVSCDYLTIKDSTASTTIPFYAGANSVDKTGNTNWTFSAPPSGAVSSRMMMMGMG